MHRKKCIYLNMETATEHQAGVLRHSRDITGESVGAIDQHRGVSKKLLRKTCLHQQCLPINFLKFCTFLEKFSEGHKLSLLWRFTFPPGVETGSSPSLPLGRASDTLKSQLGDEG